MEISYANDSIGSDEVVKYLGLSGQSGTIFPEMIRMKEVVAKAKEERLSAPDEELQRFADSFRSVRALYDAEETQAFLDNAGLSLDDFEEFCEAAVLTNTLREHLAPDTKVQEYFVTNRADFDHARISVIVVGEETLANEIVMQVTEDEEDFHALAREHSADEQTKYAGGYVGLVRRAMLPPETSAKVFSADPGDVLGPFDRDGMFRLVLVEEVIKAELTDDVRDAIKEKIFNEWLAQALTGEVVVKP